MSARLDLEHLQTLVAIADTGSFAAAAETVHRTQSAVSMQMKRLEESVGQPLFEKQGRRAVLTMSGQNLLLYARRIVSLQHEALASFHSPEIHGEVRFGVCDDYVMAHLPPVLSRFATRYPQVHIRLDCQNSGHLIRATRADELDFALVNVLDPAEPHEPLRQESLVWATSRDHLVHERRPLPLAIEGACHWGLQAQRALDDAGIHYRLAYSTFNVGGLIALVNAGLAVTPMTSSAVQPSMRVLDIADGFPSLPPTTIGLVQRSAGLGAAAEALVSVIRDLFRIDSLAA